jgi:hypothetical protein
MEHRRDVNFDGVFRNPQLVRDLLVQQTVGHAHEHAHLLRRQLRESSGKGEKDFFLSAVALRDELQRKIPSYAGLFEAAK